ncbi:MAG: hypothetical protein HDQ87_08005 [Clostridia bacterium]|nr:hypothetical protein [Clostridia bacterium]
METKRKNWKQAVLAAVLGGLIMMIVLPAARAGDVIMTAPVYLNGLPEYTLYGSAGLANVACDAVLAAAEADVAVLNGGLFASSLPAGPVTWGEFGAAMKSDPQLIRTQVTGAELTSLLNDLLVYGSEYFPQVAGIEVQAARSLNEQGDFCGTVSALAVGRAQAEPAALYSLVTTEELYSSVLHLPRQQEPLDFSIADAAAAYGAAADARAIEQAAVAQRIAIVSDTIDLTRAAAQLMLRVPSPVVLGLTQPDLIPDTLVYALQGQDRFLCTWFPLAEIPYALCLHGSGIEEPRSVATELAVSQEVPSGRKTANTFSDSTVFVDLRENETIPPGSRISVDLSGIYPAGMLLYLYYYDENGDIVPLQAEPVIAENGSIILPAESGMTYVINDRQLNQSALLIPTPAHPWWGAVAAVFVLFALWMVLVLRRRARRSQ